jgi:hypothetical protein
MAQQPMAVMWIPKMQLVVSEREVQMKQMENQTQQEG